MPSLLPSWPLLSAFLVASLVLAVTPGPGVMYIVTRSLSQGRSSGLASVAGVALGNLCSAVGAAVGLGALLAYSTAAFTVVKLAGALYLVVLGVQALRAPSLAEGQGPPQPAPAASVLRDGFAVALLNPKTAIFFGAFLPQFMADEAGQSLLRSVVLGALFVVIAAASDSAYALLAGTVGRRLVARNRHRMAGRYAVGGTYIGLGLLTAAANVRGR